MGQQERVVPDTLDTLVAAQTPEGILFELRPAGLTARCYAFLLDELIKLALLYVLQILALLTGGAGLGMALILLFTIEWLYPVVFELSGWAATPGKRALGLKVIMDNGLPVTPAASLIRNLLRAADFLPLFYGAGVVSMLLRRDFKRVGDLAAATLVVYQQPRPATKTAASGTPPLAPALALTPPDQAAAIALAERAPRLRPRANFEAADLGVRLCQSAARDVYTCYLAVYVPLMALAFACYEIDASLPVVILWWSKPWLDRTILFTLSRAAFGQRTRPIDVWREQRQVWWGQLLRTFTTRRLSMWRSLTQPVYQLEGLHGAELRARVRQIRAGRTRAGTAILSAFSCAETALSLSLASLVAGFAPQGYGIGTDTLLQALNGKGWLDVALSIAYAMTIGFVEPFFVAAGFALYLSRRAELEAGDIEQEFRRAFTS